MTDGSTSAPLGSTPPSVDRRFARSAAFWLRAYPRRWRVERGGELTAVLADLAEPGARGVDARTAAGLVRAGCATRRREHPPLRSYLAYRLFERRLPARYHPWVRDDIDAWHSPVGVVLQSVVVMLAVVGLQRVVGGPGEIGPRFLIGYGAVYAVASLLIRRTRRRQAVARHLVLHPGDPVVDGAFVDGTRPRRRTGARAGSRLTLALVAAAALAWPAAALASPHASRFGPCADGSGVCADGTLAPLAAAGRVWVGAVLAVALIAGVALVPLVRRRVRTLRAVLPAQPNRALIPVSTRQVAGVAGGVLVVGSAAWLEGTGRMLLLLAPTAGALALLVLPGVVTLALLARDLPAVAWSDLRTLAVHGRAPAVDEPVACPVPVVGPVPPGARLGVPRPSEHPWRPYPAVPLPGRAVLEVPESAGG